MKKTFMLNTEIVGQLRNKVNEHTHLITLTNLSSTNKKVKPSNTTAWLCICAIMDRIDDSSHYLIQNPPKSDFEDKFDAFKFYNFLNISASMLDCIDKLSDIFNIDIRSPCIAGKFKRQQYATKTNK